MKTKDESLSNFYWQNGYGAFSVSPLQVNKVVAYINNQHVHHGKINFQDEYRGLLTKNEVAFDEGYVWD